MAGRASRCAITALWILSLSVSLAAASAEVLLRDGRVLSGTDIRREGDLYLLAQESGAIVPLPLALVIEVRLLEEAPPPEPPAVTTDPTTGITYRRDANTLAGTAEKPKGIDDRGPRQLAGDAVRPPSTEEQLHVFGKPAEFPRGVIDPNWKPGSGWVAPDPTGKNLWSPAQWSRGPIDPFWVPSSGFRHQGNALDPNRSTWQRGPIDPYWKPTSGF